MGSEIYQANPDGTEARKLLTVSGAAIMPRFSPDGSVLRFTASDDKAGASAIWEVRSDGSGLHRILPGWNEPNDECCGSWTPDGRYCIFEAARVGSSTSNLWALPEKEGLLGRASRESVQLTAGPLNFHACALSIGGESRRP
jgi:Tol biopolymer transport system component